jgi:hypothetical protein
MSALRRKALESFRTARTSLPAMGQNGYGQEAMAAMTSTHAG